MTEYGLQALPRVCYTPHVARGTPDALCTSLDVCMTLVDRKAIEHAPNAAMEAGVLGNLGALLLGVAGRVEDSLDLIERSIARFSEARLAANPLFAGAPGL